MKKELDIRKQIKRRKPSYVRQHHGYFPKLSRSTSWRKPRGLHSKIRKNIKGHRSMPEVGYGSPKTVRGLDSKGFKEVLVSNVSDLSNINKKIDIVVIRKTVGTKKKVLILEESKKLGLNVSNVKDIDAFLKSVIDKRKLKKEAIKKTIIKPDSKKKADKKSDNKKTEKKVDEKKSETKKVDTTSKPSTSKKSEESKK